MKIIVTGGSGFLGKELISLLLKQGHEITNIDKVRSGINGIDEICHDLTYPLSSLTHRDACIHLASGAGGLLYNQRADVIEYNRAINENTYRLCAGFDKMKFIFISSINVFEDTPDDVVPTPQNPPVNVYAKSKWDGEKFFADKFHQYFIVRPSNIFGKSQIDKFTSYGESHVIPDLIHKIKNNPELEVWGDGSQLRNFIHVSDVSNFLCNLLNLKCNSHCFNITSTITCSIGELAQKLVSRFNPSISIRYNDDYMQYEKVPYYKLFNLMSPIGTVTNILDGLEI